MSWSGKCKSLKRMCQRLGLGRLWIPAAGNRTLEDQIQERRSSKSRLPPMQQFEGLFDDLGLDGSSLKRINKFWIGKTKFSGNKITKRRGGRLEIIIGLIVLFIFIVSVLLSKGSSSKMRPSRSNEVTFRVEAGPESYGRSDRPKGPPAKWHKKNTSVNVKGYDLQEGLIYVGSNLPAYNQYRNDACLIDPKLSIKPAESWFTGDNLDYWPHYSEISPKCRGAYLKWLAGGRREPEANIGYVFLFFYGLERRLCVDGLKGTVTSTERQDIVNEVIRLLSIYGDNRSFRRYASTLLAMEWALFQNDKPVPNHVAFEDVNSTHSFQLLLAKKVAAGQPIPPNIALQWFRFSPEVGNLRTPARRCAEKFRNLFTKRYHEKFGDGIVVKPNKTRLRFEYIAASPSIRIQTNKNFSDLPNPFILKNPVKKIEIVIDECTQELDPYSRYLGRKGSNPKSLTALSLIPKDLINQTSGAKTIHERLTKLCNNGIGFLPLETLYKTIGQKPPVKLLKKENESLATFIENIGFGLAPDVRYHNMKPALDGNIAIFLRGHGVDFRPSKEFRTVGTILRLGVMVSQIDKDIAPAEETTLQSFVKDNRELTNIEKDSLLAFLHWCLRTKQNAAGLKARLSEVSDTQKTAISHILVSVAHADGEIKPKEIKQLEKFYTTLGLNKEQVTGDIHVLAAQNGPVTVGVKDPDTSFAIPQAAKPAGTAHGFVLNEELIKIRQEESTQVKSVLEDIFSDQEEDEPENIPEGAMVSDEPLSLLDQPHQNLFNKLVTKESWEREAFQETCKSLGLMIDGAMEVLNEWAFESANAPLIDDGEPIYVDISLAKELVNVE